MNFEGYKRGETTVSVNRHLTKGEFEEIELLLKKPLGRYKSYANTHLFVLEMGHILNTLLVYLRKIKAPHQMEMTVIWDGTP